MSPKVSIIVTSYCPESRRYLDLCMRSIKGLSYDNLEVLVVGRPDYLPQYEGARTISPPEREFLNGRGINYGVEQSSGEYLFILNDDVILTKDCVQPLLRHSNNCNVMPVGNDQQGRYYIPYLTGGLPLEECPIDTLTRILPSTPYPSLIFADTLCLYAHMVHRSLWDKVGPMDDGAGLIDIDWCLRVRNAGHMNAIELSSLVWHFGGVSVEHTLDTPKRLKQKAQFKAKWGGVP